MTDPDQDASSASDPVLPEELAEQLVTQARAAGVSLTGPGGLLSGLTRQVLERIKIDALVGLDDDTLGGMEDVLGYRLAARAHKYRTGAGAR